MRIAVPKATLYSRWTWTTLLGLAVFAVLAVSDMRLKALSGFNTYDLQGYWQAWQYRTAYWAWAPAPYAVRAGFNLGFDYLLMPLYAASFFYSGMIAFQALPPHLAGVRRIVGLLVLVPLIGALLDAVENALELWMLLAGATDGLADIAFAVSSAKMVAIYIGLFLLAGAVFARVLERKKRRLGAAKSSA